MRDGTWNGQQGAAQDGAAGPLSEGLREEELQAPV